MHSRTSWEGVRSHDIAWYRTRAYESVKVRIGAHRSTDAKCARNGGGAPLLRQFTSALLCELRALIGSPHDSRLASVWKSVLVLRRREWHVLFAHASDDSCSYVISYDIIWNRSQCKQAWLIYWTVIARRFEVTLISRYTWNLVHCMNTRVIYICKISQIRSHYFFSSNKSFPKHNNTTFYER